MPGWLIRSDRVRAYELLTEFLRSADAAGGSEEVFQQACDLLCRLWGAESVSLWRCRPKTHSLQSLAASPPESEFFGELDLEAFPALAESLAEPYPQWIKQPAARWRPLPPPLLQAASVLLLPIAAGGEACGCLFGCFPPAVSMPGAEELEAGVAMASALGLLLRAEGFREEREFYARRQALRRRAESDFARQGFAANLQRVADAARELLGAEAVGVYEQAGGEFRRVAEAGVAPLLPGELPRGDSLVFPWERALAEGQPVTVRPGKLAPSLQPWLPQLARSKLLLRVQPLQRQQQPLGVMLFCQAESGEPVEGAQWLVLLASLALENRNLEQQREQGSQRFRAVFDLSGEALFFLDLRGVIRRVNPALLRSTGYSLGDLRDQSLAMFLSPQGWDRLAAWLESEPGQPFVGTVEWRTKAGAWEEVDLLLHPLPTGESEPGRPAAPILGRVRYPSRELVLEEAQRETEARLVALLDSVHDGVWMLTASGHTAFTNQRLGQLLGVNPQQFKAGDFQLDTLRSLKDCFDDSEKVLADWEELHRNPDQIRWDEIELLCPRRRVLERFSRPLFDEPHRLSGRLEVYRDISGQRLLEDKVLHRERLAALGQLVSGIAHELNNPLTAVTGYAQLLRSVPLSGDLQEKAQLLAREADRAARVVQNLLLFAREAKAEKQAVDLPEILERTLSLRAYELRVANIRVVRDYEADAPPVFANPHHLQQVFLNLLLNAEQAIRSQRDKGCVTLRIRSRGSGKQNRVRVEVCDDGPGIPSSALPYIFDPFFTTKSAEEGTGLGLAICQAIVKEHGGEIAAQNTPGGGAQFHLELPAYSREAKDAPEAAAEPSPPKLPAEERRILVVDDEPAVANLIADALRQQGYSVRVHTESDLALAEAFREPFHLAVCDLRMPEVDGRAFYRALRDQGSRLAHRLLFTTGDTLAPETAEFLATVRLPYLAKPFRVEELRHRVELFLQELENSPQGKGDPSRSRERPWA